MKIFILFLLLTISNVALGGAYPINGGFVYNSTVETTSGTTTTLVATSNQVRIFEGSLFQILKFPNAQLLPADWSYEIVNNSDSFITVRDFDSSEIASVTAGRIGKFQLKSRASQAGSWKYNVNSSPSDLANYFTKAEHLSVSAGASDAGKPIVLDAAGKVNLSMIPLGGSGDVTGPASATDNALAVFDGITGKLLKEAGPAVSATGNVTAIGFTGPVNGNSTTAGAFDHDPSACPGGQFATDMAADGTLTCGTPSVTGDVSSNTSSSVDGEIALFSGTGGKTIKRATGSGIAKITSGVLGTATSGTDYAPATSGTTLLLGDGLGGTAAYTAQTCTNQALTALSSSGAKTCSTISSSYVDTSIAQTGVDINTSHQVTATHLAAGLPINQGGTGQTSKAAAFDALSPMTTSGDIIYGGASGTGTRLAKGSDGDVLTLASGIPSWAAPSGGGSFTNSEVIVDTGNGYGSTNTKIRRWTNARVNTGTDITYADSATNGGSFTINTAGVYAITAHDSNGTGITKLGITVNDSAMTTNLDTPLTYAQGLRSHNIPTQGDNGSWAHVSWTGYLAVNDVVRQHDNGTNTAGNSQCMFSIVRVR